LSGIPGVHPFLQPLWGSGHGRFRELVDRAHAIVREGRFGGRAPAEVTAEVRALTRELDDWGFTRSHLNNPPIPNIYLFPGLKMFQFVRSLGVGRSWAGLVANACKDSIAVPVRKPRSREAETNGVRSASLMRLVARDLRILLDL
jgi:hypothetical protein